MLPSGGWRAGLCWTILVANLESHLSHCVGEKTAYRATRQRVKRSIAMVVEKEIGTVGITR